MVTSHDLVFYELDYWCIDLKHTQKHKQDMKLWDLDEYHLSGVNASTDKLENECICIENEVDGEGVV